jgi:superfamily II DNA or RNA helicase
VLFVAHRSELVTQAAATFRANGLAVRTIQAEVDDGPNDAPVVVASLPTLVAKRWAGKPLERVSLVVIDEAHHGPAAQWRAFCEDYPQQLRIGLTATPVRSDGKPLGDVFDKLIQVATVAQLTKLGYLTPCVVMAPPSRQAGGTAELPEETYLHKIRTAPGVRRTVIFCDQIESAERCVAAIRAAGARAEIVHGGLDETTRYRRLALFRSNELDALANVAVLTEGWDDPGVTDAILARPCMSAGLFLQIVGRILRVAPGKTTATLWDLCGAVHEHGLPDAEREYSLDGAPIKLADPEMLSLAQCLACGACVTRPANGLCPVCGARLGKKKEPIALQRAELQRIAEAHTQERREAHRARLEQIAKERGYKHGWIYYKMEARYGHETTRTNRKDA